MREQEASSTKWSFSSHQQYRTQLANDMHLSKTLLINFVSFSGYILPRERTTIKPHCGGDFLLRVLIHLLSQIFVQKDASPPAKPTHGIIYVASSYPPWQHATLNTLKDMYNQLGGNFPDNRDIMNRMKETPEVKSAMKKLMPFVQHVKVR